jgi:hypothetical protein
MYTCLRLGVLGVNIEVTGSIKYRAQVTRSHQIRSTIQIRFQLFALKINFGLVGLGLIMESGKATRGLPRLHGHLKMKNHKINSMKLEMM